MAGIQPGYLPWLGYFDQMLRVDRFLVADELPFSASGWTHRNRVLGHNGPAWLRLPARPERGQRICDVRLDPSVPWRRTHLRTLRQAYARGPFATEELDRLEPLLDQQAERLVDVVTPVLLHLAERLRIDTPITVSSEAHLEDRFEANRATGATATDRIISYLEAVDGDALLEGAAGADFLDVEACRRAGIDVEFHRFDHPTYPQRGNEFVSHLSVLDLLLTHGHEAASELLRGGVLPR